MVAGNPSSELRLLHPFLTVVLGKLSRLVEEKMGEQSHLLAARI
jgi:hypothetical protein